MVFFDFIVTPDWINAKKPDPEMMGPVFQKFEQAGVPRQNIILIGDTLAGDWQLAQTLKLEFFAVLAGGINSREEFLRAGVPENRIIYSVADLPDILIQKP